MFEVTEEASEMLKNAMKNQKAPSFVRIFMQNG